MLPCLACFAKKWRSRYLSVLPVAVLIPVAAELSINVHDPTAAIPVVEFRPNPAAVLSLTPGTQNVAVQMDVPARFRIKAAGRGPSAALGTMEFAVIVYDLTCADVVVVEHSLHPSPVHSFARSDEHVSPDVDAPAGFPVGSARPRVLISTI